MPRLTAASLTFLLSFLVSVSLQKSLLPVPTPGPYFWFSFGDSYTQTVFNHTGALPSDENPIGNPPYPGWTSTGGENWVDYLTTKYNSSKVYTYNYAFGGGVIDSDLVTPYRPDVLDLIDQTDQFLSVAAKKPPVTPWTSENSLFSVWIGINDIGNSFWLEGDRDAFNDVLLNKYFELVEKLVSSYPGNISTQPLKAFCQIDSIGARNFLFVFVPPIERSPMMLVQPEYSRALEGSVIASYNRKVAERAKALEASHKGVKTLLWDAYKGFEVILNNPTAYGFKDATSYGPGEDIFWSDNLHPTSIAHRYLAEQAREVLKGTLAW